MGIDLKKILGANYRDDLTLEEIINLLNQDDSMVSVDDYNTLKQRSDKNASEAAKFKKELNASKSQEELIKQQQEEVLNSLQEHNKELEKKLSIIESEKEYVAMGYDEELAHKTAVALVEGDMKSFFKNQKIFKENQEKKFKSDILKDTVIPEKEDDIKTPIVTREQLSKMPLSEINEFAEKNPDEYKKIYEKGD